MLVAKFRGFKIFFFPACLSGWFLLAAERSRLQFAVGKRVGCPRQQFASGVWQGAAEGPAEVPPNPIRLTAPILWQEYWH